MELEGYLNLVINKIKDAQEKDNIGEVIRVLRSCAVAISEVADKLEGGE